LVDGQKLTVKQIAKKYDLSVSIIRNRLYSGMSIDEIIVKDRVHVETYKIFGRSLTTGEITKRYEIPNTTLYRLIKLGANIETYINFRGDVNKKGYGICNVCQERVNLKKFKHHYELCKKK
jgi:riboflavin synthase alpha subunit